MHDIFISYSSQNKQTAQAICHTLEQNRFKCWIAPRDIPAGSKYTREINRAISACKLFIIVYSKDVLRSEWIDSELTTAISKGKIILSYKIDDTPYQEGYELMLQNKHWIEAYPDPETKFAQLVTDVAKILGREIPDVPLPKETEKVVKQEAKPQCNRTFGFSWKKMIFTLDLCLLGLLTFFLVKNAFSSLQFMIHGTVALLGSLLLLLLLFGRFNSTLLLYRNERKCLLLAVLLMFGGCGFILLCLCSRFFEAIFREECYTIIRFFSNYVFQNNEVFIPTWQYVIFLFLFLVWCLLPGMIASKRYMFEEECGDTVTIREALSPRLCYKLFAAENVNFNLSLLFIPILAMLIGLKLNFSMRYLGLPLALGGVVLIVKRLHYKTINSRRPRYRRFMYFFVFLIVFFLCLIFVAPTRYFFFYTLVLVLAFLFLPSFIKDNRENFRRPAKTIVANFVLLFMLVFVVVPALSFGCCIFSFHTGNIVYSLFVKGEKLFVVKEWPGLGLYDRQTCLLSCGYAEIKPYEGNEIKGLVLKKNSFQEDDIYEKYGLYDIDSREMLAPCLFDSIVKVLPRSHHTVVMIRSWFDGSEKVDFPWMTLGKKCLYLKDRQEVLGGDPAIRIPLLFDDIQEIWRPVNADYGQDGGKYIIKREGYAGLASETGQEILSPEDKYRSITYDGENKLFHIIDRKEERYVVNEFGRRVEVGTER